MPLLSPSLSRIKKGKLQNKQDCLIQRRAMQENECYPGKDNHCGSIKEALELVF